MRSPLRLDAQSRSCGVEERFRVDVDSRRRIQGLKKSGNNSTLRNSNAELIKQAKSELRMELETLKKDTKYKLNQIENNS